MFAIGLIAAIRLPSLAAALTILMLPLEQVVQGAAPSLRGGFGGQLVNYLIGGVCLLSTGVAVLRTENRLRGTLTPTLAATLGVFLWALISLLWSPSQEAGFAMVSWGLPYLGVTVLLAPILVKNVDEFASFNWWIITVGLLVTLGYLTNPEFEMRLGRLTMRLAGGASVFSSALSVGELGGTVLIAAALARGGEFGTIGTVFRFLTCLAAIMLAIISGSRGQFFFAIIVVALFIPVAAPIRSVRRFFGALTGIGVIAVVAYFAMNSLLEGFAAKRFDTDQILYGSSSAAGRLRNIFILLDYWTNDPKAILLGLGYNAFAALPESNSEPYSHVMLADALFELGPIGFTLTIIGLYLPVMAGIRLFRTHASEPRHRAAIATLLAQITYQFLLVNKQGSLWGVPVLFFYLVAASRIEASERLDDSMEGVAPESVNTPAEYPAPSSTDTS